ncbi:helix-turn-helix domain-containing protein [Clostridium sp. SHJSY1]|uniref:helix-turn-helix domain-containing protein n=1 Tax=Clostridium sp. SHJSY1 TaxID=2942483 RepID=UPI0028768595|nr:helix-turn-helix domain-containing protein [Clostridium sp. SHJSY1]MDS0525077.1 helix-turn-helix domain-containing protein [Clostridium sp. SHJSY1]
MRKEFINFASNMPINISFCSIKEYPIHWHNSIEVIYVLKGKVKISIDTDSFELFENELEIINVDETHSISSTDDNKLLIFHIDPSFLSKYYKDIKNVYFYTNTSDLGAQEGEEYDEFRTFLAELLYEFVQKQENYDEEIQDILINLLYHLINNFHYLLYEQEDLKDNKEQLERYHRISKYIYNNYNSNITLQEIAKKEFLTPHYLSHEIKNATGYSFTDLLNLTRVEESVKLLLDTDMSISEISDEVGFSHTRYLNKHFKIYYNCTPLQFRRKNRFSQKLYESLKKITYYPIDNSVELLSSYLNEYERYNYENKLWNIHVDMNLTQGKFNEKFREILTLGDTFDLLIEDNKDILEELQEELHFNYGRLENFFSEDMGVFKNNDFFNWNRARTVLEFLDYIELKPLIVLDNANFFIDDYIKVLESFKSYFSDVKVFNLSKVKFQLSSKLCEELKLNLQDYIINTLDFTIIDNEFTQNRQLNPIYDTTYMVPYIIHKELFTLEDMSDLRAFDVLERETHLNNEVFIGASGLINDMAIRKPSYYAYYLMSKLSGNIVAMDNGYIVTKSSDGFNILLYTYSEILDSILENHKLVNKPGMSKSIEKKISLNLTNINKDSRMTFYEINDKLGSSYNYWVSMGKPDRLSKEEKEILSKASFPKIEFKYAKKSSVLNIITKLKGYGAILIIIK